MSDMPLSVPGTLLWIAPFYDRSGYGVGARSAVSALHRAGIRITTLPVGEIEPGIDDFDLDLIRSLEKTRLLPPITTIVSHVPSRIWLDLKIPEPNLRIINTTFDSSEQGNLPPVEWIDVCREMDQVWLMSERERDVFISAGLPFEKVQIVWWPHQWLGNPFVPPATPEPPAREKPFRFLSIAMFLPRRRWHTLIEAFLEEFNKEDNVELYLKVNYPTWHPVPGKPRQDLLNLVESLRKKTGSEATLVFDEEFGTRMGIVNLIDSCNAYITTDTAPTAPMAEARVRRRMLILPQGVGTWMPDDWCVYIAANPDDKIPLTGDMLLYQPHHKDTLMPQLHVRDVQAAMRCAYDMSPEERLARADRAGNLPDPNVAVQMTLKAINSGWEYKEKLEKERKARQPAKRITWEGSQFVSHSLALINRELCLQLIDSGFELSILTGNERDDIDPGSEPRFEKIVQRTRRQLAGKSDIHVRHHWPPNFNPPPEGRWVMIQPWEYGRLPEAWIEPMATMVDEIWVPSRHVLKTCISSGIPADLVQVVPNGVNIDQFHPQVLKRPIETSKKFRFLFVGGGLWRKGVDILLDAYRAAFTSRDDVVLIIKDLPQQTIYIDQGLGNIIHQIRTDPGAPEILHLQTILGPEELPGLYSAADCLVHPYRAEGFGLPVLEAMACAVPVITSQGGSTDDFCPPDQVCLIPSSRRDFNPNDIRLAGGGGWVLEPDWKALSGMMREVFENRDVAGQRALSASEYVRLHYNWQAVAEKVKERIHQLAQKSVRRDPKL